MGKGLVIPIASEQQREYAMARANAAVAKGVQQGAVEIEVRYAARELSQNAKFHAMIADIHYQCFRGYSADGVKAVLVNQFALEMEEQGEPLAKPGEKVWDWKSKQAVYVRPSTTKFRKAEAAAFIEFLYATGVELGVNWSEPALAVYESYKEAAA
ncbi:recombination protein NinB [Halomonas sp. hl-4]|uniref:recombination protein NinB n=1 Tax=Halomonas sp. hl-4 TaxID=1761789 RepID=UPI000BB8C153|nr:recombination protein NinB [Halomonas sp. hl-4]SNY95543.1 NinB protein [Halomonas sp. hl-4]